MEFHFGWTFHLVILVSMQFEHHVDCMQHAQEAQEAQRHLRANLLHVNVNVDVPFPRHSSERSPTSALDFVFLPEGEVIGSTPPRTSTSPATSIDWKTPIPSPLHVAAISIPFPGFRDTSPTASPIPRSRARARVAGATVPAPHMRVPAIVISSSPPGSPDSGSTPLLPFFDARTASSSPTAAFDTAQQSPLIPTLLITEQLYTAEDTVRLSPSRPETRNSFSFYSANHLQPIATGHGATLTPHPARTSGRTRITSFTTSTTFLTASSDRATVFNTPLLSTFYRSNGNIPAQSPGTQWTPSPSSALTNEVLSHPILGKLAYNDPKSPYGIMLAMLIGYFNFLFDLPIFSSIQMCSVSV